MTVRGIELAFDITCPEDLHRYRRCCDALAQREQDAPPMPHKVETPAEQEAYVTWLTAMCSMLTDWIDGVFGAGASNALLGERTSLDGLLALCEELRAAAEAQGEALGKHLQSFVPNRSTRRSGGRKNK